MQYYAKPGIVVPKGLPSFHCNFMRHKPFGTTFPYLLLCCDAHS